MRRIVVLGTGTGVGKTHVSVALGRTLGRLQPERRIALLKPVETGFAPGASSDAKRLAAASRGFPEPEPHPRFGFEPPISPHLAARRAGLAIDVRQIVAWVERFESRAAPRSEDLIVIETAGGVFSPLSDTATNLELAMALEPATWLLVAPDALGVLHEMTATVTAMTTRARAPDFVVLSTARARDSSTGSNTAELQRLRIVDPVATLGRNSDDLSALVALLTPKSG